MPGLVLRIPVAVGDTVAEGDEVVAAGVMLPLAEREDSLEDYGTRHRAALGVTEQTYYRWRKEYGGMRTNQAKKLKTLEKENTRLKTLVAELSLDNAILQEVLAKK